MCTDPMVTASRKDRLFPAKTAVALVFKRHSAHLQHKTCWETIIGKDVPLLMMPLAEGRGRVLAGARPAGSQAPRV